MDVPSPLSDSLINLVAVAGTTLPVFEVGGYLDKVSKRVIAIANTKGESGALIKSKGEGKGLFLEAIAPGIKVLG